MPQIEDARERRARKRKARIEANLWTGKVTPITVECRACTFVVKLNDRGEASYYWSNFKKHLGTCNGIKQLVTKYEKVIGFSCLFGPIQNAI
jgi:hypothetical protein